MALLHQEQISPQRRRDRRDLPCLGVCDLRASALQPVYSCPISIAASSKRATHSVVGAVARTASTRAVSSARLASRSRLVSKRESAWSASSPTTAQNRSHWAAFISTTDR